MTEDVIDEFMGDNARAGVLREMRAALTERLSRLRQQKAEETQQNADASRLVALSSQIATLKRQIEALQTEEAVSQFVEDSLRVALAKAEPISDDLE
jgi:hypothetical protein